MARPIPRLEPVTRTVSVMGCSLRASDGRLVKKEIRVGWAENAQARISLDTWRLDAAGKRTHAILVMKSALRLDTQGAADREAVDIAFVLTRAQEEAQAYRPLLVERVRAGPGGNALCHQFDTGPGRKAAIGAVEKAARANHCGTHDPFGIELDHAIEQAHVAAVRYDLGNRPKRHVASPRITLALLPPNAKELLMT